MSEKKKWRAADAILLASVLKTLIGQYCERIEIAGSLRRQKEWVGDIELLYIPRFEERPDGLFDKKPVSLVDECLDAMLKAGELQKRPSKTGVFTWGAQNKLGIHVETGIPVDFFATDAVRWWVALVIRTGSKETNLRLTTGAQKRGGQIHAYGSGVTFKDGREVTATSEQEVFDLCGVPYLPPEKR